MTSSARYDVLGIGNAIVDILHKSTDAFLEKEGISKGTMTLIDAVRADVLASLTDEAAMSSGGSAANTLVGFASLGGNGAYIGKVRDDRLGLVYSHDLRLTGLHYKTPPATHGLPTARCFIFVTPDGQRSMNTYLGASTDLNASDIDEDLVQAARITYLEGYLFDKPHAKDAFIHAANIARAGRRKVALTLSDPFCVDRHRDAFQALVRDQVDILFANEAEILSFYQTTDLTVALEALRATCPLAIVTRSEKGCVVVTATETLDIPAEPVAKVIDTTGAGDLFAAGFLFGHTHGQDLATSARLGTIAAAEIISHFGPRPETSLKLLAEKAGIL
jgi:sugar/nucleoside kinase (ribokinase family)